jgi:hypothetical protein
MVNPRKRRKKPKRKTKRRMPKRNKKGRFVKRKKTRRKTKRKTTRKARRKPMARKRKRRKSPKRRKRRTTKRRKSPKRRKRRTTKRRKTRRKKRRAAPKRRRRRRTKRRAAPKRRRRRRKNPRRRPYRRRSKRRRTRRKSRRRRNVGSRYSIRTKNPKAADILIPVALGTLGFLGTTLLMKKLPATLTSKLVIGGKNLAPIVIPAAAGLAAMLIVPKYWPKGSKAMYGIGFGLLLAAGVSAFQQFVPADLQAKMGLAGYVRAPGNAGYVTSPFMSGYVQARSLGQVEPGMVAQIPGRSASHVLPPGRAYGRGMPAPSRTYDEFRFSGVYKDSVYEF